MMYLTTPEQKHQVQFLLGQLRESQGRKIRPDGGGDKGCRKGLDCSGQISLVISSLRFYD